MSEKFDAEKRAAGCVWTHDSDRWLSVQLMREAHAAGAREKAEEIATECRWKRQQYVLCKSTDDEAWTEGYGKGMQDAMEIARRHAAPPSPETREQRLEKALREVLDADVGNELTASGCGCKPCKARRAAHKTLEEEK